MKHTLFKSHGFAILLVCISCGSLWGYGTSKSSQSKSSVLPLSKPILSVPFIESEDANVSKENNDATPKIESSSFLDSISMRGVVGMSYNSYSTDSNPDNFAFEGNIDLKKEFDFGVVSSNVAYLYDLKDENRRYLLLNELYTQNKTENSLIQIGRNIRNWGVMEAYSVTDVFNTKNYLSDSFDMSSKYGAFNAEYTYSFDDQKVSLIAKMEENDQPYPDQDNIYNYLPLPYDGKLETEKSKHRPSIYLKYSGSYSDDLQIDYTVILQNGYDNKRYFTYENSSFNSLIQYAYLVNKSMFYGNIAYENVVFKLETAYTDVLDDPNVSDYTQASFGIEYLPSESINGAELRLLLEYYKYFYADGSKLKNQDFSEMFNNDVFVGVQSSFGDAGSSEIKGGCLYDFTNHEQTYVLNFGTRMKENYRLSMEWMVVVPGDDSATAIGQMGQYNQVTFRANYFF